jgi:ribose transport system ATP-binding protein
MTRTAQSGPVLRLADVRKSFDGVDALKGVTFEARAGEIHALLGENGAGKSTLMAIAAGSLVPDEGLIELGGEPVTGASPLAVRQRGLSIAYQHPALVPDLTVAENIAMWLPGQSRADGAEDAKGWARSQLARVGCTAGLGQRVASLSVIQRQLLEVAKAVAADPRVLILDEPTASLGAEETATLFAELRRLAAGGVAVVYITHRLAEVRELCQRVTVLRDGAVRGSFPVAEASDGQLLELIVGRAVTAEFPPKAPVTAGGGAGEAVLVVEHFSNRAFHDVTLTAAAGEIVGLAGIVGNGQAEFLRALAGLVHATGRAELRGTPLRPGRPDAALDAGVVYLSSDRLGEGLFGTLSVRENALVSALGQFSRAGVMRPRAEDRAVEEQRSALAIKAPSIDANVLSLSGGNQQKVLLARALLNQQAALLLAEEPTQGVDVGARAEIYRILRQVAAAGAGVVIVSTDTRELEGLCDRVLVFSSGQVVTELRGEAVTEDAIAHAMLTSTRRRRQAEDDQKPLAGGGRRRRPAGALAWLRQAARGDYVAPVVLAVAIIALGIYTQAHNARFLSSFNLTSLTVLIAATAFISFGQECVIVTGGIDLSVGPLAGLVVVIGSFFENSGHSPVVVIAGFLVMLGAAAAVGVLNGSMVRFAKFTPIVATLVTYIALQGVSLVLRPFQGGYISFSILGAINHTAGPVAIAFLVAVVVAVVMERALRRSRWGRGLRAIGSDPAAAFRLGVRPGVTVIGAYVASSLFACVGGVLLMAQIGVGDPTQGVNYTLASVTAVVLGGTSIFGGRGSFIGALFGAILVEQLLNVTTFLQLSQAWQYWFQGVLVMAAVGIYTQARTRST